MHYIIVCITSILLITLTKQHQSTLFFIWFSSKQIKMWQVDLPSPIQSSISLQKYFVLLTQSRHLLSGAVMKNSQRNLILPSFKLNHLAPIQLYWISSNCPITNMVEHLKYISTLYSEWGLVLFCTCSFPIEEETLTILGESDNWRRGMKASIILFGP